MGKKGSEQPIEFDPPKEGDIRKIIEKLGGKVPKEEDEKPKKS